MSVQIGEKTRICDPSFRPAPAAKVHEEDEYYDRLAVAALAERLYEDGLRTF